MNSVHREIAQMHAEARALHPDNHLPIAFCDCRLATAYRQAKQRAIRRLPNPPLIAGGQGRSAADVEDAVSGVLVWCAILLSFAVVACIAWACGTFN
jgi:hypothetical protein